MAQETAPARRMMPQALQETAPKKKDDATGTAGDGAKQKDDATAAAGDGAPATGYDAHALAALLTALTSRMKKQEVVEMVLTRRAVLKATPETAHA